VRPCIISWRTFPWKPFMTSLLDRAHTWVVDYVNVRHLERTLDWLLELDPHASEAAQLAALTHDMERHFPGPDEPRVEATTRGWGDPLYNEAHSKRSARIVAGWLREQGADPTLIEHVVRLIEVHEDGGWPEADLVQAADSLSFLETNVEYFLSWIPVGRYGVNRYDIFAKIVYMYERIRPVRARELARPLYDEAVRTILAWSG